MSPPLPCPVCGEQPLLQPRHQNTFPGAVRQMANYSCRRDGHFISSPSYEAAETVPLSDPRLEAGARVHWNRMLSQMRKNLAPVAA